MWRKPRGGESGECEGQGSRLPQPRLTYQVWVLLSLQGELVCVHVQDTPQLVTQCNTSHIVYAYNLDGCHNLAACTQQGAQAANGNAFAETTNHTTCDHNILHCCNRLCAAKQRIK